MRIFPADRQRFENIVGIASGIVLLAIIALRIYHWAVGVPL